MEDCLESRQMSSQGAAQTPSSDFALLLEEKDNTEGSCPNCTVLFLYAGVKTSAVLDTASVALTEGLAMPSWK